MNEDFDFFIRDGKVMAYDFNSFVGGIAEAYRQGYEIVDPHKADKNGIQRYVHVAPVQGETVEEQQQQNEETSPQPEQQETNVASAEEETDTSQTELEDDAVSPSSVTPEDVSHLTKDFIEEVKKEDGLVGLKELGEPFGITDRSKDKLAKELLTFAERVRGNVS